MHRSRMPKPQLSQRAASQIQQSLSTLALNPHLRQLDPDGSLFDGGSSRGGSRAGDYEMPRTTFPEDELHNESYTASYLHEQKEATLDDMTYEDSSRMQPYSGYRQEKNGLVISLSSILGIVLHFQKLVNKLYY